MSKAQAFYDVVSQPFGTARLLEASSTLKRAKDAKMTYEQICKVFPDAAKYPPSQLDGFIRISEDLIAGQTRFKGSLHSRSRTGGDRIPEGKAMPA